MPHGSKVATFEHISIFNCSNMKSHLGTCMNQAISTYGDTESIFKSLI